MTSVETPDVLRVFHQMNGQSIEPEGIRIPQMVYSVNGKHTICAMAIFGEDTPIETYRFVAKTLLKHRPDELVFGLDRFTKPGQGVATADALSVHHWNGRVWRVGVIAYQFEPKIFDPIDWNNAWWLAAMQQEMTSAFANLKVRPGVERPPAITSPIPFDRLNGEARP